MTFEEFSRLGIALKSYYPKEQNFLKDEHAIKLWYEALKDLPYDPSFLAIMKWVETEKWSPTIADIRLNVYNIENGELKSWDSAWENVLNAISSYGYARQEEAFDTFDDLTKMVVGRIGWINLCMSEEISIERASFRDIYKVAAEKQKREGQMAKSVKAAISKLEKPAIEIKAKQSEKKPDIPEKTVGISDEIQKMIDDTRRSLGEQKRPNTENVGQ